MFVYFSETQAKRNDFRSSDVFVVMDTERRERKSWTRATPAPSRARLARIALPQPRSGGRPDFLLARSGRRPARAYCFGDRLECITSHLRAISVTA